MVCQAFPEFPRPPLSGHRCKACETRNLFTPERTDLGAFDEDCGGCRLTDSGDRTQDVVGKSTLIGGTQTGFDLGFDRFEGLLNLA